jgi:hypothetical protein
MVCDQIDLAHEQDLLSLFNVVTLANANQICLDENTQQVVFM